MLFHLSLAMAGEMTNAVTELSKVLFLKQLYQPDIVRVTC